MREQQNIKVFISQNVFAKKKKKNRQNSLLATMVVGVHIIQYQLIKKKKKSQYISYSSFIVW